MEHNNIVELNVDSDTKRFVREIDADSICHEDDTAIKAKLDAIPGFKSFMMEVICPLREKMIAIEHLGNGIKVSSRMMPRLDELLQHTCDILGVNHKPSLSLMWLYDIVSTTDGAKNPHISTSSGTVDLLTEDEQMFMLGHELGHQMCGHKPYHLFLETLFLPIIETIPGGKQWTALIKSTLLHWYRISDFTADRVGLLACQDINVALSVIVKKTGIPKKYYDSINISAFIQQAEDFDKLTTSVAERGMKYLLLNAESHPWTVSRAAELLKWYQSGEYEGIISNQN